MPQKTGNLASAIRPLPDPTDPTRPIDARPLAAAVALARSCEYEAGHAHQVTRLALRLFDELQSIHRAGPDERHLMQCGALLHDIGWIEGQRRHHKTSQRMILSADLPLTDLQRAVVALIARYHRKALPRATHASYASLAAEDQATVRWLAGTVRFVDGLDRTHTDVVQDLRASVTDQVLTVRAIVRGPAEAERAAATAKGDLLAAAVGRPVCIELEVAP